MPKPIGHGLATKTWYFEAEPVRHRTNFEREGAIRRVVAGETLKEDRAILAEVGEHQTIAVVRGLEAEKAREWVQQQYNRQSLEDRVKVAEQMGRAVEHLLQGRTRLLISGVTSYQELLAMGVERLSRHEVTIHCQNKITAEIIKFLTRNVSVQTGTLPLVPAGSQDMICLLQVEPGSDERIISADPQVDHLYRLMQAARPGGVIFAASRRLECSEVKREKHLLGTENGKAYVEGYFDRIATAEKRLAPDGYSRIQLSLWQKRVVPRLVTEKVVWFEASPSNTTFFSGTGDSLDEITDNMLAEMAGRKVLGGHSLTRDLSLGRAHEHGVATQGYRMVNGQLVMMIHGQPHRIQTDDEEEREHLKALAWIFTTQDALARQRMGPSRKAYEEALQAAKEAYEQFVLRYGPVNSEKTRQMVAGTPDRYVLSGLEREVPPGSGIWVAGPLLEDRHQPPPKPKEVLTPEEALAESLERMGRVDLDYMGARTRMDLDPLRESLGTRIVYCPMEDRWEETNVYCVGDAGAKIEQIKELLTLPPDPARPWLHEEMERTLTALQERLPPMLPVEELELRLADKTIPAEVVEKFGQSLFGLNVRVADVQDERKVTMPKDAEKTTASFNYSTAAIRGHTIFARAVREGQYQTISLSKAEDTEEDEEEDKSKQQTEEMAELIARNEMIEKLNHDFKVWLMQPPQADLARQVEETYHRTRNCFLVPQMPEHVPEPAGLNPNYSLRHYQARASYRAAMQRNMFLYHFPGAGKTLTLATAMMRTFQSGRNRRWLWVTLDNLIQQTVSDLHHYYPELDGRVQVINSASLRPEKIMETRNELATLGTGSVVVMSYTTFERLPLMEDPTVRDLAEEVSEREEDVRRAGSPSERRSAMARLNKVRQQMEEALAEGKAAPTWNLEEFGDGVIFDEGDILRNLRASGGGMSLSGKNLTSHTLSYLEQMRQRLPNFATIIASGTLKGNSEAEYFAFQRYLQPEVLQRAKIDTLQQWSNAFIKVTSSLKLKQDGKMGQHKTFTLVNAEELRRMVLSVLDVVTEEEMSHCLPQYAGGKPQTIVCQRSFEQMRFYAEAANRLAAIKEGKVSQEIDNALKICTESIMVALDPALLSGRFKPHPEGKLCQVAKLVAHHYHQSRAERGVQLVFADVLRTKDNRGRVKFGVLEQLRTILQDVGIPAQEIVIMHEVPKAQRPATLERVRRGEVAVVLSGRGALGRGANIQDRGVATYDLTLPWNPSDELQAMRRFRRAGNRNQLIYHYIMLTENSMEMLVLDHLLKKMDGESRFWKEGGGRVVDSLSEQLAPELAKMEAYLYGGDKRLQRLPEVMQELAQLRHKEQRAHKQRTMQVFSTTMLKEDIATYKKRLSVLEVAYKLGQQRQWTLRLKAEIMRRMTDRQDRNEFVCVIRDFENEPTEESKPEVKEARTEASRLLYRALLLPHTSATTELGDINGIPIYVQGGTHALLIGEEKNIAIEATLSGASETLNDMARNIGRCAYQYRTTETMLQGAEKRLAALEQQTVDVEEMGEKVKELENEQAALMNSLVAHPPKLPGMAAGEQEVTNEEAQEAYRAFVNEVRQKHGLDPWRDEHERRLHEQVQGMWVEKEDEQENGPAMDWEEEEVVTFTVEAMRHETTEPEGVETTEKQKAASK